MSVGVDPVRPGPAVGSGIDALQDHTIRRFRLFLIFNVIVAVVAGLGNVVTYFGGIREPTLLLAAATFGVLTVTIEISRRMMRADRAVRVMVVAMVANWLSALVVTWVTPFAMPLHVLQVLLPLLVAATVFDRRQLAIAVAFASVTAAAVALLGLAQDDNPVDDRVDENMANASVVVGLGALMIPFSMIAWDANHRHRLALDNALRTNVELQASRSRLVSVADEERRRLERDLHDGAQQRLVAVTMGLRLAAAQHSDAAPAVEPLVGELESALEELRNLAHGIYPPLLESRGLNEALRAAARRSPLFTSVRADDLKRYDEAIEAALYFCTLEALQNAAKHAGPEAQVEIVVVEQGGRLRLSVTDDGEGFDRETAEPGRGVRNIADRVGAVGGEVTIAGRPGSGTTVEATVPVG